MRSKKTSLPTLEQVILALIENDLIHSKLINGLKEKSPGHTLNLNKIIFLLMGFRENEITKELVDWYFLQTGQAILQKTESGDDYKYLAHEVYHALKTKYDY